MNKFNQLLAVDVLAKHEKYKMIVNDVDKGFLGKGQLLMEMVVCSINDVENLVRIAGY